MASVAAAVSVAWRFSMSDSGDGRRSVSGSVHGGGFVHRSFNVSGSRRERLLEQEH